MRTWLCGALCALAFLSAPARAQPIAAEAFIDQMTAQGSTLSPDGARLAYIATRDTEDELLVRDIATGAEHVVQIVPAEQGALNWVVWKGNDRLVVGANLEDSDRVLSLSPNGGEVVQIYAASSRSTHGPSAASLLDALPNDPDHVLLEVWDATGAGAWRGDVHSGQIERVSTGSSDTWTYATDVTGTPVLRTDVLPDGGGYRIFRRGPNDADWVIAADVRHDAATTNSPDFEPVAAGPAPGEVYVFARANNADVASLYLYNTATGELGAPLQHNANADASMPWINPRTRVLMAACAFAEQLECRAPDAEAAHSLAALNAHFNGQATLALLDVSADGAKWLVQAEGPLTPGGVYLYEPARDQLTPLLDNHPQLSNASLSPTRVVAYQARDGAPLWAYVTARADVAGPRPMVVMPHGGPESRDYFGYDAMAQFLASRGYVVVQPNFRGGIGFGRAFADAGRRQWGQRMQDDVTDAVQHMIASGVADPQRVCIVGASYGGYAALAGVSLTPDLYRCAISISGVSDLRESLRSEANAGGRASVSYQYWQRSIGDPSTDRAHLIALSPRFQAARVTAPVLLIHGDADDTVPIHQSELMDEALRRAGHPARFVRIPDEAHVWLDWTQEHRLTLFRETEAFLAANLAPAH